ncbi:hypothetical protein WJX73_004524 [Symbiochloris irregularis]|uniref:Calcineurin-like phosphoesterase domain-containing protein n=1 Tax=Symbiochloris irregularis TaxID=706552 RepID=A0AAW1PZ37_9CHLO
MATHTNVNLVPGGVSSTGRAYTIPLPANWSQDSTTERSKQSESAGTSGRQFRFGIISDVQYANIDDGLSYSKVPRYYRASRNGLARAVSAWREQQVEWAIHLGDLVDGFQPRDESEAALDMLLAEFDRLQRPHWHVLANHDLYNFPREVLNRRLGLNTGQPEGCSYYHWSPHPQWRIVVLDAYDVSVWGWPPEDNRHKEALKILERYNPNEDKNNPSGLEGPARRFVQFNGGASATQLGWLRATLADIAAKGQRAIVCCHVALHPETAVGHCLLWNYQEVLDELQSSNVVVATFAGHAHCDGQQRDHAGIHHRVLNAIIETPPDRDCYGWVDVFPDRLELTGVGELQSSTMSFAA